MNDVVESTVARETHSRSVRPAVNFIEKIQNIPAGPTLVAALHPLSIFLRNLILWLLDCIMVSTTSSLELTQKQHIMPK